MSAFIIEPIVQGAGGMRFYSPDYLRLIRDLCNQNDVLMIADEIATGFGRTGKMLTCEHADISPDIMTVGKALTGGYMTFASTLCSRQVADTIENSEYSTLMHGPTFMGNPLACWVAIASIDLIIQNDYPARARDIQGDLKTQLSEISHYAGVADVRIIGAIGVIELHQTVDMPKFQRLLLDNNIWVRPFGKLIYIMPPIIMTTDEICELCDKLKTVVRLYLSVVVD